MGIRKRDTGKKEKKKERETNAEKKMGKEWERDQRGTERVCERE